MLQRQVIGSSPKLLVTSNWPASSQRLVKINKFGLEFQADLTWLLAYWWICIEPSFGNDRTVSQLPLIPQFRREKSDLNQVSFESN